MSQVSGVSATTHTITFDPSLAASTITLSQPPGDLSAGPSAFAILGGQNITIDGLVPASGLGVTIAGSGNERLQCPARRQPDARRLDGKRLQHPGWLGRWRLR